MPPSNKDLVDLELQPLKSEHDSGSDSDVNKEKVEKPLSAPNNSKSISACSLYSFCSVSMVLVNKSLASR